MATGKIQIHTENILPIIKRWLYSDKDIFIRELIANSCDAQAKLKTLQSDCVDDLAIKIEINKEKKQITISDSGLGMTAAEVEKYIAQLAFSGAQEFLENYKVDQEKNAIIGHFGLGFYSAYMVANLVEIDTLSYQDGAQAVHWACDGGTEYQIQEGQRQERGTTITLHIDQASEEYLEENHLLAIVKKYCAFLPFPIFVNGEHINQDPPLWLKAPSECSEDEYVQFFEKLYPQDPAPLFWIHLNVDYPFHLKGILYFPKITKGTDFSQNSIKLFCNKVFVSDHCKEILPEYLTMLKGALDSPDIPLNVSRSSLQMDKAVRQISSHIAKKVADQLLKISQNERERFINCYQDLELIIKFGMLQDEKFYERAKEILLWKTTKNTYLTIEQYLENNPGGKIFYTNNAKLQENLIALYENKVKDILASSSPIDAALMNFLEQKVSGCSFQRLDGALDDTLVNSTASADLTELAAFYKEHLGQDLLEVQAKSLESEKVPALLVMDESTRRLGEILSLRGLGDSFPQKNTFVINANSKLIQGIYALGKKSPEKSKDLVEHVYDLATISQKELTPERLASFLSRSSTVLETLLQE